MKTEVLRKYISEYGGVAVVAAVGMVFWIVVAVLPALSDDLWYSSCIGEYLSGHSPVPDFEKWWGSICFHFNYDNIRLSNLIYHMLLFLPRWLCGLILGAGFPLLLSLMCRVAGTPRPGFFQGVTLSLLFLFGIVWMDDIWQLNYVINYEWSAVVGMYFMLKWQDNRLGYVWCFAVGLLTGWWHEGFSVPLLTAALLSYSIYSRFRTRQNTVMLVGLICGVFVLYLSPGALNRMSEFDFVKYFVSLLMVMKYNYVTAVFVVLAVVSLLAAKVRSRLSMNLVLMLLACSLVSLCIHARVLVGPRVGWFGQLTSVVGIYCCLLAVAPELYRRRFVRAVCHLVLFAAFLFMTAHLASVTVRAFQVRNEFDRAYRMYRSEPYKTHFMDFKTEKDAPFITLLRPRYDMFTWLWTTEFVGQNTFLFYDDPWTLRKHPGIMRIVPEQMRCVTAKSGTPVKGTQGLRLFRDYYYVSADSVKLDTADSESQCQVVFGDNPPIFRSFIYLKFMSEADGKDYYWIYLNDTYLRSLINPVKEVRIGSDSQH